MSTTSRRSASCASSGWANESITSPKALLFTIARNAVRDLIRRRRVSEKVLITEVDGLRVLDEGHDVVEFVSRRQELALLAEAIATLPERCRQVLLLREFKVSPSGKSPIASASPRTRWSLSWPKALGAAGNSCAAGVSATRSHESRRIFLVVE
jgi:hypothetical protein